jgi:flagellar hook-associated protein 2
MTISSPGIGSNLDVNGIVSKLMQVESQPLTNLQSKEASFQAKLSAYGSVKSVLSTFQNSVSALSSASAFQVLSATPSDASIFSASAISSASAGSYNVTVTALATAQSISTAAQSSASTQIGAGTATTLTFQFGSITGGTLAAGAYTGATFTQDAALATGTVVINSSNNSLQGIRDAINSANIGVTASVVNDGSATPYHLTLTSTATGASKSLKITSSGGDAAVTSLLAYDPTGVQNLTQTVAAQNASLSVNGLAITSASNSVSGALTGVTLNLSKAGTSSVTVANNTSAVVSAVQSLVQSYNSANATLKVFGGYNATTKTAGLLIGDSSILQIQTRLRSTLGAALSGTTGNTITNLSQVGIAFQKDGSLSLDNSKLQAAASTNFSDFAQLFAAVGKSTDSLISYSGASSNSKAGSYPVVVTSLATQGKTVGSDKATQAIQVGSAVIGTTTISAGVNDTLSFSINGGVAVSATLTAGAYTAASLATEVETRINAALTTAAPPQSGVVKVSQNGGVLKITSTKFGAASSVGAVTGNGASNLLGAAPTNSTEATIVAGINDQLSLNVNGTFATVTLLPGTYTATTLAGQIQSAINGAPAFTANALTVKVSQNADVLSITADRYGASSTVKVTGGNSITNLIGTAPTATAGTDVAGTINGVIATGSGQSLTASTGLNGKAIGSDTSTQSVRSGTVAAALTITAGSNDALTLSVDGGPAISANLTAGSYTADTLAAEVQTKINAALSLAGQSSQVTVTQSGGNLSIVSSKFGAASSVGPLTGNGANSLLGNVQNTSSIATITAGVNDQLTLNVDGINGTVTLPAGSYSASTLTSIIQTAVNSAPAFTTAGKTILVSQSADVLTLSSNSKGATSTVSVTSGSARTNLFGSTQTQVIGQASSDPAGDLRIQITGGSTGTRGAINFSQGYAFNLTNVVSDFLSLKGNIANSIDSANRSITDLKRREDSLATRLAATEKRYRAQFTTLDTLIGKLNTTSNYLQQQLANLPKI